MYSTPIQYLDDLHTQFPDKIRDNFFAISKLVDLYNENDVQALRDFTGYLNFMIASDKRTPLAKFSDELLRLSQLMIEEIQKTIYKDRTNGLQLVK